MSAVFDFPNSAIVEGISLRRDFFSKVLKEGTEFDQYVLNKDTDVIIASYPRTG